MTILNIRFCERTSKYIYLAYTLLMLSCVLSPSNAGLSDDCHSLKCDCSVDHRKAFRSMLVVCSGRNFKTVPDFSRLASHKLPVSQLLLSDNSITEIPPGAFSGLQVDMLMLNDNKLSIIHPKAFRGLEAATDLVISLEDNQITNITGEVFEAVNTRGKPFGIILDGNTAIDVDSDLFGSAADKITRLNLGKMKLSEIPTKLLGTMKNLKELVLSYNEISHIHESSIPSLPELEVLHISNNRVKHINREAFASLTSLRDLSLSNNRLRKAEFLHFNPCHFRQLEVVYLLHNPLYCSCSLLNVTLSGTFDLEGVCSEPSHFQGASLRYNSLSFVSTGPHHCPGVETASNRRYDCVCEQYWGVREFSSMRRSCIRGESVSAAISLKVTYRILALLYWMISMIM